MVLLILSYTKNDTGMNVGNKITQKPHSSWVSFYPIIQLFFRCGIPYFCKKTVLFYKHGIADINSFIEYAKSNPVLVSAQATGITDGDATTAEWFNKTFGTQITVVPVDGASDSRGMFLSGDTDIFFASISDVMASYQSGEMKVACIFSDERSDFIPDVPTIKEATGEDFVAFAARGYFYPNGVPQDIVDTTTDALLKAMEDPDYIENMAALGLQLDNTSGEDFKELLESQVETRKMIWNVQ